METCLGTGHRPSRIVRDRRPVGFDPSTKSACSWESRSFTDIPESPEPSCPRKTKIILFTLGYEFTTDDPPSPGSDSENSKKPAASRVRVTPE